MKKIWSLLLLSVVAVAAWWFLRAPTRKSPAPPPVVAPVVRPPPPALPAPVTSPVQVDTAARPPEESPAQVKRIEAPPPAPVKIPPGYLESIQQGPEHQEIEELALNIRNFSQRFGGNPVGSNAEIVQTLNGGNEARAIYLPSNLRRLNGNGEITDKWGTPYFFHANSATVMEVRSAGPDRTLFTPDDLLAR